MKKKLFTNSQLWKCAEKGYLKDYSIFEDSENNKIIWTGKSFQVYSSDFDTSERYIGMCKDDIWEYISNERINP